MAFFPLAYDCFNNPKVKGLFLSKFKSVQFQFIQHQIGHGALGIKIPIENKHRVEYRRLSIKRKYILPGTQLPHLGRV